MSTTQPPSSSAVTDASSRAALIRNVSIGALIVCPIIIALPPRKLDIYTIGLLTCTFVGGNHVMKEYTGRSILYRLEKRVESFSGQKLPEKAQQMQIRMREEKARRETADAAARGEVSNGGVVDEIRRKEAEGKRSLLQEVWMGGESDDWKAKRDKREREALAEGKGYGDLIMNQIWEVWNWGKDKTEEIKEIDEKVVEAKKEKESKK